MPVTRLSRVLEALHLEDEENVSGICLCSHWFFLGLLVKWVIVLDLGFEEVEVSLQGMTADPTNLN